MDLTALKPSMIEGSIKGKNFFFYGGPGTWKTTVASQFPRPVFGATERGYKFIAGVMAQLITSWREAKEFVKELQRDEVKNLFDTVVFDRIDTLYKLCFNYVLKVNGCTAPDDPKFNGQGWTKIEQEWSAFVNSVEALDYGLVFICHDKDNDKEDEAGTGAQKIDLQRTGLKPIRGICDFILNVEKETAPDGTIGCWANSNSISARTKKRARFFPDKIFFTYKDLEEALDKAVETQCKIEGITAKNYERSNTNEEKREYHEVWLVVFNKVKELMESESPYLPEYSYVQGVVLQGKRLSDIEKDDRYYDKLLTLEAYLYDTK